MRRTTTLLMVALALVAAVAIAVAVGCAGDDNGDDDEEKGTGTLVFTANGEEFVREGFTSKDGWDLVFDHLYITIKSPTAFQVAEDEGEGEKHGGHPHEDIPEGAAHEALIGEFFVDLAAGDGPTELGRVEDAEVGNYNRLNFDVVDATSEAEGLVSDYEGYSIVMIGTATKGHGSKHQVINFNIKLTEQMRYTNCGPNEDAGVVEKGGVGYAEMTFHFDHVFGDIEGEEDLNEFALGFDPLAELADEDGNLDVTQEDLENNMSAGDYLKFMDALRSIGHSGEAHCDYEPL